VFLESISVAALSSLYISGDSLVNENSSASYTATATFSDRSRRIVTSSVAWSENSSYAGINSSGVLIAPEVTEDTSVTIQASYSIGGVTKTATNHQMCSSIRWFGICWYRKSIEFCQRNRIVGSD